MKLSDEVIESAPTMRENGDMSAMTDAQLLAQFLANREESAFEALVARHGPRVLGVCRHVLSCPHDAEDAFQATFLVLARMAAGIRDPERLGSWLVGVAHRISMRARIQSKRRAILERQPTSMSLGQTEDDLDREDLRGVLHEEIDRLSEHYRRLVLLCYLEGRTNEDAARLVGCPSSTLTTRLARAREILRSRLSRRGLSISAIFLLLLLSQTSIAAELPAGMIESTVVAALRQTKLRPRVETLEARTRMSADKTRPKPHPHRFDSQSELPKNSARTPRKVVHRMNGYGAIFVVVAAVWMPAKWWSTTAETSYRPVARAVSITSKPIASRPERLAKSDDPSIPPSCH